MTKVLRHLQGGEPVARLSHVRPWVKATECQVAENQWGSADQAPTPAVILFLNLSVLIYKMGSVGSANLMRQSM